MQVRRGPSIDDSSEVMVMRMGRRSLASEVETDQSDSKAMSLEVKLISGEVDKPCQDRLTEEERPCCRLGGSCL